MDGWVVVNGIGRQEKAWLGGGRFGWVGEGFGWAGVDLDGWGKALVDRGKFGWPGEGSVGRGKAWMGKGRHGQAREGVDGKGKA